MFSILLLFHSILRWLLLFSLLFTLYRAFTGISSLRTFTKLDNRLRHWTATFAHVQLTVGMLLYTQSSLVRFFWKNKAQAIAHMEIVFYSLIHISLMLLAVVFITLGSSLAKRKPSDLEKFKTLLIWFSLALLFILIAIPWPFSPLAQRPLLR